MATALARGGRAPPEISEQLRRIGGRRRSAGALEPKLLDAGLAGGGRETEERSGAGRVADRSVGEVQHGSDMRALGILTIPLDGSPLPALPGGGARPKGKIRAQSATRQNGGIEEREPLKAVGRPSAT